MVAFKQAQFKLDAIARQVKNFDQKFYHKDPWHVQVFESEKVQELAELKRRELEASINLEKAIGFASGGAAHLIRAVNISRGDPTSAILQADAGSASVTSI